MMDLFLSVFTTQNPDLVGGFCVLSPGKLDSSTIVVREVEYSTRILVQNFVGGH